MAKSIRQPANASKRRPKSSPPTATGPAQVDYRKVFPALYGPALRSNEEIAEQQVREWQEEAVKVIRGGFAQMQRHFDFKSAATSSAIGHHELSQAITNRLDRWAEAERAIIAEIRSCEIANEARNWVLRQLEHGEANTIASPSLVAMWQLAASQATAGIFGDADGPADSMFRFRQHLRQAIIEDVRAKAATLKPQEPEIKMPPLTPEERTILESLQQEYPMTVLQSDFSVGAPNTAIKYTKSLTKQKLICQPNGPKKGYTLTDTGLALFPPRAAE